MGEHMAFRHRTEQSGFQDRFKKSAHYWREQELYFCSNWGLVLHRGIVIEEKETCCRGDQLNE